MHGLGIGYKSPALAAGHVLEEVETKRASVAPTAQHPALVPAAHRLTSVFENEQFAFASDLGNALHIAGQADHVDRNNRPSVFGNSPL